MQPIRNQADRSNSAAPARSNTDAVTGALANLTVSKAVESKIPAPKCCMRAPNSNLLHPITPTLYQFSNTALAQQALISAAKNDDSVELLKALHHPFVNPNQLDKQDKTPLFYAITQMNVNAVRILRQHGAFEDAGGFACLTEWINSGVVEYDPGYNSIENMWTQQVEQALVNPELKPVDPADCDMLDEHLNTALHLNVQREEVDNLIQFCRYSNRQGADLRAMVNQQNDQGDTPLHVAMKISNANKRVLMCRALLERGADPSIKNHSKNQPCDLTTDIAVLKSLEEHGCSDALYKRCQLEEQAISDSYAADRAARDEQERDEKRKADNAAWNTQGNW